MKKYIKFIPSLLLVLIFSCDEVLSEIPDNRTQIDSPEKISELLVAAYPEAGYVSFLEPMSDNADDKGPAARSDNRINEEMYFWRDLNDDDEDTPTNYWNNTYAAIAHANQALASIEEFGGGEEFNAQKGEALLCRAYAHFMLVSIFSKRYNPDTANIDLGIPYVTEPETVLIKEYDRGTVAEVYNQIEQDLEEGLPLIENEYDVPAFHFTEAAANAFASRFYLHFGKWQKVIDHSNVALGGAEASVLRDINGLYDQLPGGSIQFQYSAPVDPSNLLLVAGSSVYARGSFSGLARYQLTRSLQQDILGTSPLGLPWAYSIFTYGGDVGLTLIKYNEYFRFTNQAAGIGLPFVTYMILTTDEVLLNRAEAYVMLQQYDNAVSDINLMFSTKTSGYSGANILTAADIEDPSGNFVFTDDNEYTPFYTIPSNSLPYINLILTMRKSIFYNEGLRWFDVKRHNIEVLHRITNVNGNTIDVLTLPKDDNRRAVQIPSDAQAFNIEENPR
ncbi:MAG: RagB/SusD family nutrient uptake outer membrane protein [Algibacter sp.]|uniref:RagB/SusD family nutrient uptake outer membrane protein n=1 Tax=Algibacter sp. TaxID=1872428 RepID=UPI00261D4AFD|nr:RagB/SusD family nutrient uptake outer membrane protein [Algibacter sp.]MDG1730644.1 RagB/SusD family nutrient uptake outer membrane protein [Algibacter sp.]MDG2177595.1 RagB/SusD family nutrient uptake outer membrane protein [Algibacter sp.]